MVEHNWKVLEIGAGNGVTALSLSEMGCKVVALEPSYNMRTLLYQKAFEKEIDSIIVDHSKWEDISLWELIDYGLVFACNSLHVTEMGFTHALQKIFRAKPKNIFLVTEISKTGSSIPLQHEGYEILFAKSYEVESSYAYHCYDEFEKHIKFLSKMGYKKYSKEDIWLRAIKKDGHIWIKDKANLCMFWWHRINNE